MLRLLLNQERKSQHTINKIEYLFSLRHFFPLDSTKIFQWLHRSLNKCINIPKEVLSNGKKSE